MLLTILGSSGTYPTAANPSSGHLLQTSDTNIWFDCGSGTFAALQAALANHFRPDSDDPLTFADLDALIITHLHSDHFLDVYPLYYALRFGSARPASGRFRVLCPPGTPDFLAQLFDKEDTTKLHEVFEFDVMSPDSEASVGGVSVQFMLMDHPVDTFGLRMTSPSGVVTYSSDTGPKADLAKFAQDSDLLLCEATYQDDTQGPPLHLTASQAGQIATEANVGRLMLTHIWPELDLAVSKLEAQQFAGSIPVEIAYAGGCFDIARGKWVTERG